MDEITKRKKPFYTEAALLELKDDRSALLKYDLRGADLHNVDLRYVDLHGADLRRANLQDADLRDTDLQRADLRDADLSGTDLYDANLRRANLCGSHLEYSCWPLWYGGLHVKADKWILTQLAYIFCAQDNDDPDYLAARNAILPYANQFPNAIAWGILEPIETEE